MCPAPRPLPVIAPAQRQSAEQAARATIFRPRTHTCARSRQPESSRVADLGNRDGGVSPEHASGAAGRGWQGAGRYGAQRQSTEQAATWRPSGFRPCTCTRVAGGRRAAEWRTSATGTRRIDGGRLGAAVCGWQDAGVGHGHRNDGPCDTRRARRDAGVPQETLLSPSPQTTETNKMECVYSDHILCYDKDNDHLYKSQKL